MLTNRIIHFVIAVTSWVTVPIQLVTTFVLGILVTITFGLLLLPISLVWIVLFLAPLIGLSWMWERLSFTRPLASLLGIPLAVSADAYTAMMPSMGEMDSRAVKLLLCQTFPYTWRFWQFDNHRLKLDSKDELYDVFRRCSQDFGLRAYLNLRFAQLTNGENQEVLNVEKVTKKKGVVLGILSLVFGAIGIFWWPAVLGTIAVILGIVQLTRRRRKLGIAGLVLGIIDIILAVFWYRVGLMPSIF